MTEPHHHPHDEHHDGAHIHSVSADANPRYLIGALILISGYMVAEVTVGIAANSLALISDAGHMLTDAASIALALIAMRLAARPATGRWTYGWKRVEILSAMANGLTLLVLGAWFVYEAIRRLIDPPEVGGLPVVITAVVGIGVNIAAAWLLSKANRTSLNVEGAFQHVVNDLYAFIATAIAGLIVLFTGFARADAIATLVVAALMIRAGYGLVKESGRIFLEAAPASLNPDVIGPALAGEPSVAEVHDLHIWDVTSGMPALSAHVLVDQSADCHAARAQMEHLLRSQFGIEHTTLQVDHVPGATRATTDGDGSHDDSEEPHGARYRQGNNQGAKE